MSLKTFVTLALATGFAAAKPVNAPQNLPAYPVKRSNAFSNGFSGDGFNFIDGFNNFNQQQQVIQVQQQNLQIIDNGRQQAVVQQAEQVLIVNNQQNGFNNDLNNLFRKSNGNRNSNGNSVVMLVVQEIQVSVDDGQGNKFEQQVFAQSALVANRGKGKTDTVMLFDSKTLVAADILGGSGGIGGGNVAGIGGANGVAAATGGANLATKTNDVQLLGAKPTWSSVVEDPASTLGAIWQNELQDLQNGQQDGADSQVNADAAAQEKAALEAAGQNEDQAAKDAEAKQE